MKEVKQFNCPDCGNIILFKLSAPIGASSKCVCFGIQIVKHGPNELHIYEPAEASFYHKEFINLKPQPPSLVKERGVI